MVSYLITTTNGELYHHGIRGQKWGVRRYQNADGSLKAAGKKRYSGSSEKKGLSDKTKANIKKAAKVAAVTAASAIAIYGAYKLSKMNPKLAQKGKDLVKKMISKKPKTKVSELSKMTDDELTAKVKRLNMENRYKQLTKKDNALEKFNKKVGPLAAATSTALALYSNMDRISKITNEQLKKKKKKKENENKN